MAKRCTVCDHPKRKAIDEELVRATGPLRKITEQHGLPLTCVWRHAREHLPKALAKAKEAKDIAGADTLLAKIRGLEADARRIATTAEDMAELGTALQGIRELVRIVELQAKITGELQAGTTTTINILNTNEEWLETKQRLLLALARHPEAKADVVRALSPRQ